MTNIELNQFRTWFRNYWDSSKYQENYFDIGYNDAEDIAKEAWFAMSNLKKEKVIKENKNIFDFFKAKDGELVEWLNPKTKEWEDVKCVIHPNACGTNGIIKIKTQSNEWFDVESRKLRMKIVKG